VQPDDQVVHGRPDFLGRRWRQGGFLFVATTRKLGGLLVSETIDVIDETIEGIDIDGLTSLALELLQSDSHLAIGTGPCVDDGHRHRREPGDDLLHGLTLLPGPHEFLGPDRILCVCFHGSQASGQLVSIIAYFFPLKTPPDDKYQISRGKWYGDCVSVCPRVWGRVLEGEEEYLFPLDIPNVYRVVPDVLTSQSGSGK
jgi:hypothetical protein